MKKRGALLLLIILLCSSIAQAYFFEYYRGDIREERKSISYKLGYLVGYDDAVRKLSKDPYKIYEQNYKEELTLSYTSIATQINPRDIYKKDFLTGYRVGYLDQKRGMKRHYTTQTLFGIKQIYATPELDKNIHQPEREQIDLGVKYFPKEDVFTFGKELGEGDTLETTSQPYTIYDPKTNESKQTEATLAKSPLYNDEYYKGYREGYSGEPYQEIKKDAPAYWLYENSYNIGFEDGKRDKLMDNEPKPYRIFSFNNPLYKDALTLKRFLGALDKVSYLKGYRTGYQSLDQKKTIQYRTELNSYELGYSIGYQDKQNNKKEDHLWVYRLSNNAFGENTEKILRNIRYSSYRQGYTDGYNFKE